MEKYGQETYGQTWSTGSSVLKTGQQITFLTKTQNKKAHNTL